MRTHSAILIDLILNLNDKMGSFFSASYFHSLCLLFPIQILYGYISNTFTRNVNNIFSKLYGQERNERNEGRERSTKKKSNLRQTIKLSARERYKNKSKL